jgi:hypothetical protein
VFTGVFYGIGKACKYKVFQSFYGMLYGSVYGVSTAKTLPELCQKFANNLPK